MRPRFALSFPLCCLFLATELKAQASPQGQATSESAMGGEDNEPLGVDLELTNYAVELGLGLRKGLGYELRFSWAQDDELNLGFKFSQFQKSDADDFDEISMQSFSLLSRFNLESSFFIEGAIDYAQIKTSINKANVESSSGAGSYQFDGKGNQIYLGLTLGNQWQSGSWTYGADWINLYLPFAGSGFSSSSKGTVGDASTRNRTDERALKSEAWSIDYGLSLHAGYAF